MKIIWKKDKKKFQLLFFIGLVIFIVSAFNSTTLNVDNEHDKIDEDFNKLKLSAPTIVINSPSSNDSFDATAPSFNVRFTNENYTWYTIGSNTTKIFFLGNDTIKQYAWDKAIEGNVNITFYANDSIGDTRGAYVVVTRDTINPVVVINSPADDDPFDATAPSFNVRITETKRN